MPASPASTPVARPAGLTRLPGPGRSLQLAAALWVVTVAVHLLLAQVTLIILLLALLIARLARWHPLWLAAPAALGITWSAAIGPGRALAGFTAGPRQVLALAAGGRLSGIAGLLAGAPHWLPRQLPVALAAAAGEAAIADLARRRGLPREYRPGLLVALRGRATSRALAAGTVVTRAGCAIGLDSVTGRRAEIPWAQAADGMLAVSTDAQAAARLSFPLARAAVRRRMTVIVIDLTGSTWLADALSGTCVTAAAPLTRFSPAGPAWYEPFRGHPPARAAGLAIRMISWAGLTDRQRQAGQRCLADALAVLAATPAPPAVLDGLIALLDPVRLREAMICVPAHLRGRGALERRAAASAAALGDDPALGPALAGQLRGLRDSGLGRWLSLPPERPGKGTRPQQLSFSHAVRARGCALLSLGPGTATAAMAGRLAVADLAAVLAGLRAEDLRADCLAWVHGCEMVDRATLSGLLGLGGKVGTAVLLSTASPAAAISLAPAAGTVLASGPVDVAVATRLAGVATFAEEDDGRVAAETLRWQDEDEFAIIRRGAGFRPACRTVSVAWSR
jgi:hypothetical protein